jgi:glycosyltransferase involved in cell wall biosynthesis
MRVAYISTDPGVPYGGHKGAAVHVAELVDALAGEGAHVLALVSAIARGAEPPAPGVGVEVLPAPTAGAAAAKRIAAEQQRTDWIERRLRRFGADVLYERLALHSAAGSRAARRLGIPHLVELNAPLLDEARKYRELEEREAAERLEATTLRDATLVLAVSRPLADYARRRGARSVEIMPNAVAIERYPPQHRGEGGHSPLTAIFSGRVRPWHGLDTVAAAWQLLGDAAPVLVLAGDPGEARLLLERSGAELLGPIPHGQMPDVLAAADIGLAPYAEDAPDYFSPLKLFEYMAAGLAVVAGDLPATRELLSDDSGVLVPRGDPDALAGAVASLAADPAWRTRLGRNARACIAAGHTWRQRARLVIGHAGQPAPTRPLPEAVGA